MKKLLALLLALVMVFSLATLFAGCEDDSKKSSSKSEDKDDEDEEDDETEDEEGETTNPEDGDETDPEETEPEETEPEVTEPTEDVVTGELLDAPDIVVDENITTLALACELVNGDETTGLELGMQELGEDELLAYYCDAENDMIIHVVGEEMVKYVFDGGAYVVDADADAQTVALELISIYSSMNMFMDPASALGEGLKYQKLGVEEIEGIGDVASYNVYQDETLVYTIYVDVATGVTLNIADAEGTDLAYVLFMTQEIDFSELIG